MLDKIKSALSYVYALVILVLAALFFRERRKTQSAESALEGVKAQKEIATNEQARQDARTDADSLVEKYERLKNEGKGD